MGFADSAFLAVRVFTGKCIGESAGLGQVLSYFLYQKTWFSFAMKQDTLLKECVVAPSNTFIVELEDLVSDLSYARYIIKKKQPFASQNMRGFLSVEFL